MKTLLTKYNILFFLFIVAFSIPSNAVIDYKPDAEKKNSIIKKQKKAKKKGLFKRWKEKIVLKKLKKGQKKTKADSIKRIANLSLALGIIPYASGVLSYLIILLLLNISYAITNILIITLIFLGLLSSFIGIFTSRSVLKRIRESNEDFQNSRKKASLGLTLSMIAFIPMLMLTLAIIAYGFEI